MVVVVMWFVFILKKWCRFMWLLECLKLFVFRIV